MKIYKIDKLRTSGLIAITMLIAGCASDTPEQIPDNSADPYSSGSRIEIFGGVPDGIAASRSIDEPALPGVCDADRCRLWFYEGEVHTSNLSSPVIGASGVTFKDSIDIHADRYGDLYARNKLASYLYDFIAKTRIGTLYHYTATGIPSLAYTQKDESKFRTDTKSYGNNLDNLTLTLTGMETPELYFGRLSFPVFNDKKEDVMIASSDGVFYYYNNSLKEIELPSNPVTGRLYRIVSQLNLTVKEVPASGIERMEMYVSNYPVAMTLFGNHGYFYHVSPAFRHLGLADKNDRKDKENNYQGYILAATCDHFHNGEARLSSFFLPSTSGRAIVIRICFADGTDKWCEIRPQQSVFLNGNVAEVYFAGAPDYLKNGESLYVYNSTMNEFYSYSNVRININGDFDNIFRETTEIDVNLEICPSFEEQHEFDID